MAKALASEKRSVAASDGVRIEYEVAGAGPPLVLMHGGFASRFTFSRQRAFAEAYRLIVPSSRGHDGTDGTLPPDFGFDTSEITDLCSVLNAEGVDRTNLLGHSSGGATAFALARAFPERVNHLVLIEPTLLALLPSHQFEMVAGQFQDVLDRGARDGDFAALRGTFELVGGVGWRELDEETKNSRLQALAPLAPLVAPHARGLLALKVTEADVRSLHPRTLLIYGTASYDFEPAIQRRLTELRPDMQLLIAEGAGHNVHRDRSDIVNAALDSFLRG